MRFFLKLILSLILIVFRSVGGFFAATKYCSQIDAAASQIMDVNNKTPVRRRINYYRHTLGEPYISAMPKKDSVSMDYLPVYSDKVPAGAAVGADAQKIMFYRYSMGDRKSLPC